MRIPFAGTKYQILQLAVDFGTYFFRFRDVLICQAAHVVTAPHCGTLSRVSASAELRIRVVLSDTLGDSMLRVSGHVPFASMSMGDA